MLNKIQKLFFVLFLMVGFGGQTFSMYECPVDLIVKSVDVSNPCPGEFVTYTISVDPTDATGSLVNPVITDTVAADLIVDVASITSSIPSIHSYNSITRTITWSFSSTPTTPFTVSFSAKVDPTLTSGTVIADEAVITYGVAAARITCHSNIVDITVNNCSSLVKALIAKYC